MDELLQKILIEIQNNPDDLLDTDIEHCNEYYVEQNLWRLPVNLLAKGITTIHDDEEFGWIKSSIQETQKTCREKANWLIYKALDDRLTVIDAALEHYGADVFKNETWADFPELQQDLPENAPTEIEKLEKQIEEQNVYIEHLRTLYSDELRAQEELICELKRIPAALPFGLYQVYNEVISLINLISPELKVASLEMKADGLHVELAGDIDSLGLESKDTIHQLLNNIKNESLKTCFICGRPANPKYSNYTDSERFLLCDHCYETLDSVNHPEKWYSLDEVLAELNLE